MMTATDLEFAEVQVQPALAVQAQGQSAPDPGAISAAMATGFESLMAYIERHNLSMNGQPRAIYNAYSPDRVSFTLAIPVEGGPANAGGDQSAAVDVLPGGKAYRFLHHGPYYLLSQTYGQITAFMLEKGCMKSEADWSNFMPMWEEYLNDAETTPAAQLLTYIYLPAA